MRTPASVYQLSSSVVLLLSLGCFLCSPLLGSAASGRPVINDYLTQTWSADNGLPHNVVNRVLQDDSGYLWLATAAGLTRFDGQEFKKFHLPPEFIKGGYNIRDIAVGEHSSLLVVTVKCGVLQLQGNTFSVHPITESVDATALSEIYTELDGTVWVGSHKGVLTRWQNGNSTTFGLADGINRRGLGFYFAKDENGRTWIAAGDFLGFYKNGRLVKYSQSLGEMIQIAEAKSGGIWVLVTGRLMKLENDKVESILPEPPWHLGQSSVRCFFEDRSGILWLGTSRMGLFRYSHGKLVAEPPSLPGIQSVMQDREGNIWLATDGSGIRRLRPKAFKNFGIQAGSPEIASTSICEDPSGDIWFAHRSAGLMRKHGEKFQTFPYSEGKSSVYVSCIYSDRSGNLWVGAPSGLYQVSLSDPATLRRVDFSRRNPRVLFCTQAGVVWVAFYPGIVGYYRNGAFTLVTAEDGYLGGDVTAIAEDPAGVVWLGTLTGDLYRVADGKATRVNTETHFPESAIHALHADSSGRLWIGTLNGLVVKRGNQFRYFTRSDGLPDDMILHIVEDDSDRLWLGGPRGLFNVAKSELQLLMDGKSSRVNATTYGTEEGLPGISPSTRYFPSTLKDTHGVLWFATHQGVVALDPTAVVRNHEPPPVKITRVVLDNQPLEAPPEVHIPPGRHHVEFHFAALSFMAPEKVRIRHQLQGVDPDWVDTTSARSARYTNLPPGTYRLQVIACNNDGIWNHEGATLAVTVIPAWWQTGWFYLGGFVAFTGLVVWGARYWTQRKLKLRLERLEQEHALEKERTRISRDMHDELGSSITGIGLLVDRLKERSTASDQAVLVEHLTDRTRRLAFDLERVVWTVSPKNNSLHHLAVFVGRFAQNFLRDTTTQCLLRGQDNIPPHSLTPDIQHHILAVAKEAINNVIKHARATQVVVETSFNDGVFVLSVRDDGGGFTPEAPEHSERNGLSNMRARVAEVGGEISIRSERGKGTEITLSVPIKPAPVRAKT